MILKYKQDNGRWRFITLTDFSVGKVDITDIYNKYIDDETGKFNPNSKKAKDSLEIYQAIGKLFQGAADYNIYSQANRLIYNPEIIDKHMHYLVVSLNDLNDGKSDVLIIYNEAYLMSDEGKTIEKLM